jgi:hypothetical protein
MPIRSPWAQRHNVPEERSFATEPGKMFELLDQMLLNHEKAREEGGHPLWDETREVRLAACKNDLELFGKVYFGKRLTDETPDFHKELFALAQEAKETNEPLAIAAPRGHAKSTILSFLLPIHELLYQTKKYIVIISDTHYQATLLVGDIRYELENNPRIKSDFGTQIGNKWTGAQILTKFGIRVAARGAGSQIRGLKHGAARPDLVIADDMENDEQVQTIQQRDKVFDWWNRTVIPALDPKTGTLIIVGTIIHFDGLLARLLNPELANIYVQRRYRTPKEDGTPLWPARYSIQKLADLKAQIGSFAYNSEYLNIPIDEETQVYKPHWWKWYTKEDIVFDKLKGEWLFRGKPLSIYQGVDPAIGTTQYADWFAHVTIGVTEDRDVVVLWSHKDRIDFPAQIKLITEQYYTWLPKKIGIEIAVYQKALKQQLVKDGYVPENVLYGIRAQPGSWETNEENPRFFDPAIKRTARGLRKLSSSKRLRIVSRSLLAEQGQVFLREALPEEKGVEMNEVQGRRVHHSTLAFFQEATEYPRGEADDLLDAFDDALQCATGFQRNWAAMLGVADT